MSTEKDVCSGRTGVPACGTGHVKRLRFVGSELRDVWRELRRYVQRSRHPEAAAGSTKPGAGASATEKGA